MNYQDKKGLQANKYVLCDDVLLKPKEEHLFHMFQMEIPMFYNFGISLVY